mmetsp:Transcript_7071/g.11399  ORF Transcript_7071/g.11399 Transcript_7071/m.11399 type:complete len:430 (+) Transcript_7071:62-1351(+)
MFALLKMIAMFSFWLEAKSRRVRSLETSAAPIFPHDWESTPETSQVVYQEIGRCYDPDGDWSTPLPESIPWAADFNAAVEATHGLGDTMPNAQVLSRPLTTLVKKMGSWAKVMPWHSAAAITNDRMTDVGENQFYADSHCFRFDYTQAGIEDPHGCGFFRKSFQPLQALRQCVLGKLEQSANWKVYEKISKRVVAKRRGGVRDVENPMELDDDEEKFFEGIAKFTFDGIRRVDEMIKYASSADWEALDDGLIAKLESQISKTIITKDNQALLEKDIVSSIRKDCFSVEKDTWAELSGPAKTLKRAMPCYQLMWDQIEVSGGAEEPFSNGIAMFDPSLRYGSEVTYDIKSPPVCARAAVALIADRTKSAPRGYNLKACLVKDGKSWPKCLRPNSYNCICFTHCFRRALEKMCEFNAGCCPLSITYNRPSW